MRYTLGSAALRTIHRDGNSSSLLKALDSFNPAVLLKD